MVMVLWAGGWSSSGESGSYQTADAWEVMEKRGMAKEAWEKKSQEFKKDWPCHLLRLGCSSVAPLVAEYSSSSRLGSCGFAKCGLALERKVFVGGESRGLGFGGLFVPAATE